MANFTPSKKTAQDFNKGQKYINGDGNETGDVINADTPNNLVESALYTQNIAESAKTIAQDAKDLVDSVVANAYAPPPVGLHHIQYAGEPTPASIWAGTTWVQDGYLQGKAYTQKITNSVEGVASQSIVVATMTLPANSVCLVTGHIDSNISAEVQCAITLSTTHLILTSRTPMNNGGGVSTSFAITTSSNPQTVTLSTYGYYNAEITYRGTMTALIIQQSNDILWKRTA